MPVSTYHGYLLAISRLGDHVPCVYHMSTGPMTYKGLWTLMRQVPAMHASEQLEAAWDREVGVPPGVRTDSKTGCSSHTGLATQKQRVGAHARALLRSAV